MTMWTCRQHQGASRTSGSGRRSCRTHQNVSTNGLSEEVNNTHQVDLERSQTSQVAKRLSKAMSTAPQNATEVVRTMTALKRSHQVEIPSHNAIWADQRCREVSRVFGTAERLLTAPNTMGCVSGAMGTRTASYRTCHVKKSSQETIQASQGCRETSRAIGAAKAMEMASDTMGDEMVRMVQQAAHAATHNESKRDR